MDHALINMTEAQPVVVVMVPFPAQGHLNQLLHFSRQIAAHGLPVHFVGSAAHNHQVQLRVHGWDPLSVSNIRFHDFPLPHHPSPPPDPLAPHSFPVHLQPTFETAIVHLRSPFSALVRSLSSTFRRVAVIHDPLMSFAAQESSTLPNVEAYAFHCISAMARFCFQLKSLGSLINSKMKTPISLQAVSWPEGCFTDRFLEFVRSQHPMMAFDAGSIYNSCWPIEGEFLDMLSQEPFLGKGNRLWAVGPVNPIVVDRGVRTSHGCLEWLDKQPPRSVLYVSFGTLSSLSNDQVQELAKGLERSGQRFIWVLREADRGDIFAKEEEEEEVEEEEEEEKETNGLPEEFEQRVKGVGVVVRDWAPQLEILAHRSTGGFMSHCGWNSCIESIGTGVPIAAWPMHSDQPRWGTDYFIKAHTHPNVLWAEVGDGDTDHYCWQRPEDMTTSRQAYKIDVENPGSDLAGETAAAMAAASIVFRSSNPHYSHLLLHHAQQLFEFGDKHRGAYDGSVGVVKSYYASVSGYKDELLWAALWLYRATDREDYFKYVINNAHCFGGIGWAITEFSWDVKYAGVQILAAKLLMDGGHNQHSHILQQYKSKAEHYLCSCLNKSTNDSNVDRTPSGLLYIRQWNNMQYVSTAAFLATVYADYLNTNTLICSSGEVSHDQLISFAKSQVDYILGSNPLSTSYLVGFGPKYPKNVHHRGASILSYKEHKGFIGCTQGYDCWYGRREPNPNVLVGALVGGPDCQDRFDDNRGNYMQTEACTYNTAPLVGVFARLNQLVGHPSHPTSDQLLISSY